MDHATFGASAASALPWPPQDLLVLSALLGFAAAGLGALVRSTASSSPLLARLLTWTASGKPLACHACMGGWSALLLGLFLAGTSGVGHGAGATGLAQAITVWLAATGIASWLLAIAAPVGLDLD